MTAKAQRAFSGGIISPVMFSRSDVPKFDTGLKDALNMTLRAQGGTINRAGTKLSGGFDNSTADGHPWLIAFEFSADDSYQLEFADEVMRVMKQGEYVLTGDARTIVALTSTNPAEIEFTNGAQRDEFPVGSLLFISDSGGTSPLNGAVMKVASHSGATNLVVEIVHDETIDGTDSTWATGLTGSATAQPVFELATPYAIEDLPALYAAQDVDTMFIACPGYDPRVLQRGTADDEWTLSVMDFEPSVSAPTGVGVEQFDGGGTTPSTEYTYVGVLLNTSLAPIGVSNRVTLNADFSLDETEVTLSWTFDNSQHSNVIFAVGRTTDPSDDLFGELATNLGPYTRKFVDDNSPAPISVIDLTPPLTLGQLDHFVLSAEVRQTDTQQYVVTAVANGEESLPSAEVFAENDLTVDGRKNRVSWSEVEGAESYNVYKNFNGIYGFIGITTGLSFDDDNVTPDTADNPPTGRDPFQSDEDRPSVVTFIENRLTFANTPANPQIVEMSNSINPFNFNRSFTPAGSDPVTFRMRSQQLNRVEHVVFLGRPVILTAGAEWVMETPDDAPIEPANFALRPRAYRGSSSVKPAIIGETLVHVLRDGNTLREFSLRENRRNTSADLTILARRLFRGKTAVSMSYAQSPDSILWVVFTDGTCLSLTYLEEHEVWGWTRHEFGGPGAKVRQVSVVREGAYDVPYFVVERTGGAVTVERLDPRDFTTAQEAYFVDSGLQITGTGLTQINGLLHLRGEAVSVLADGNVIEGVSVDGYGRVAIPGTADTISAGYAYTARIVTLPVDFGDAIANKGSALGDYRAASEMAMQVVDTRGISVGREGGWLNEIKQFTGQVPIPLVTGTLVIPIEGDWERDASLVVEQRFPLPMEITSITPEWSLAD